MKTVLQAKGLQKTFPIDMISKLDVSLPTQPQVLLHDVDHLCKVGTPCSHPSRVNVQVLKGSFQDGEGDDLHVHECVSIKPDDPMSGILSGWDKLGLDHRKRTSLQRLSVSKECLKQARQQRNTSLETVAELTKKIDRLKQRDTSLGFQNTNTVDDYNNESDDSTAFEKTGINVSQLYDGRGKYSTMDFMTGEGDDHRVLVHVSIKHNTQTTVPAREESISHDSSALPSRT